MRVLVLKDRRPGHFHQAEGLAAIIAEMTDATIESIDVRPRRLAHNWVRKSVLRRARDPAKALRLLYDLSPEGLSPPDVVIGCGRPTVAAGILIARATGARFLYSGFLRDYDLNDIDLVLVRSARQAGEPHCVLAPIPTTVNPDRMRRPRPLHSIADLARAEVSLLLGGPAPGYRFADDEWRRIAEVIAQSAATFGIRWSVSNSRRTPDAASKLFGELTERGVIAGFVDYRQSGQGSAAKLFAADAIVTTEDSMTMMAEAMAARRPVVALKPAAVENRSTAEEIATMAVGGGLAVLPIRSTTAGHFARTLVAVRVPERDPRDLIAQAIAPVLGLDPRRIAEIRSLSASLP
jgi:hypothetical protein